MNAKEWTRIIDLMCQIKRAYNKLEPTTSVNRTRLIESIENLNELLNQTEKMAIDSATGWF